MSFLKKRIHQPVILFPGSPKQFTKKADALLYLSLISGRNPKYLIGEHVKSAIAIKKSKIEVLSTSYIIINKEIKSSVLTVSNTLPISPNEPKKVLQHALAGELQGKKITFLDAGSGAINTIPLSILAYIRSHTRNPIIIGGGINKISQIDNFTKLGANVIVIGNAIEKDEKFIDEINHFFEIKKD